MFIIPLNIIVVDDLNDETDVRHQVIPILLLQLEELLMNQFQNDHLRRRRPTHLMNHQFMLVLLSADRRELRLHHEEDVDPQREEDLYDQESLKEVIVNDDHPTKKCSCSTAMQNITIIPR